MKKKRRSKLKLNRETLRDLEPDKMGRAAGAAFCTSDRCSNHCTGALCTQGLSECACPYTDDFTQSCFGCTPPPTLQNCTFTC